MWDFLAATIYFILGLIIVAGIVSIICWICDDSDDAWDDYDDSYTEGYD